jgi:hypothetical protein
MPLKYGVGQIIYVYAHIMQSPFRGSVGILVVLHILAIEFDGTAIIPCAGSVGAPIAEITL